MTEKAPRAPFARYETREGIEFYDADEVDEWFAARSQPATEGLDEETLQYALEAVDPAAFPVRGTVALDHENVDHFRYAHAVAREYAALAGTEPAGDGVGVELGSRDA